jgi:hypothetical protein
MNVAFKHLESKLRFGELTIGQWATVVGGLLFGLAFAQYLSPVGGVWGAVLALYLGAVPASAAFFASLSEFDLAGLVAAALRRSRQPARYLPGAGESARGYLLTPDGAQTDAAPAVGAKLEWEALWD